MRKLHNVMFGIIVMAAFSFVLLACPQDPQDIEEKEPFQFTLDTAEYQYYVATGEGFSVSDDVRVTLKNTGANTLEGMYAVLTDDEMEIFSLSESDRVSRITLPDLASGDSISFKIFFPQFDLGASMFKPSVIIGNTETTKLFKITYGTYNVEDAELTFSADVLYAGETVTVTSTESDGTKPWIIGTPGIAAIVSQGQTGTLKLLGTGEAVIGYVESEDPFTVKGKKVTVVMKEKPAVVTAFTQTDNVAEITFDQAVSIDPSGVLVKVNDVPRADLMAGSYAVNTPSLDLQLNQAKTKPITAAEMVGTDGKTWKLTLWSSENPPAYGDILRLGIVDRNVDNKLGLDTILPEIILKNPTLREKQAFETEAGFYRNGVKQALDAEITPDKLFQETMRILNTAGTRPLVSENIHIVLDSAQNYEVLSTNNLSGFAYSNRGRYFSNIFVTRKTGVTEDIKINVTGTVHIQVAGSLTYVIEDGIVFDGAAAAGRTNPMFFVEDGGRIIIDGATISNFHNSTDSGSEYNLQSAFAVGGGNWGGYLVINKGKITGNTVTAGIASGGVGCSTITTRSNGFVFMHGGEISNNKVIHTGTIANLSAGAISSGNGLSMQGHFYMTGGEIFGNTVEANGETASAGGVLVTGAFQKTGGIIEGSDAAAGRQNTTQVSGGKVKASAVVVLRAAGANPDLASTHDKTSGSTDILFVDNYKPSSAAAVHTVPPIWWGNSLTWD